jgi:uncharacterized membrane protein YqaE (UPF0057 family)
MCPEVYPEYRNDVTITYRIGGRKKFLPRGDRSVLSRKMRDEPIGPCCVVGPSIGTKGGLPMDVIRILFAILLPPVGVFLQVGIGLHFWLNILLTLCGYIPGIIHAIWVIIKK